MLIEAVILRLFAVSGSPTGESPTPSALAVTTAPLRAGLTLGQWRGDLVDAGGARHALEVSVGKGLKADTVFGYFLLSSQGRETTVRRLGHVDGEDLVFDLREGGRVALRLRSGRLVGEAVDPTGQLGGGHSTIELTRRR
jgi:hypothetical protein